MHLWLVVLRFLVFLGGAVTVRFRLVLEKKELGAHCQPLRLHYIFDHLRAAQLAVHKHQHNTALKKLMRHLCW